MELQHIVLIYLAVINVVAFFMYGIDKWKAKRSKWRVPEATLLGLAVLGGSIGAWLGMKVWHHKTLHKKFRYGVPLILIAQIALIFLCSCRTKQHVEPLLKVIKEYKVEIIYDDNIINGMALKKPDGKTLEETMQYFKTVKGVTHVEYDHVYRLTNPVKPRLEIK